MSAKMIVALAACTVDLLLAEGLKASPNAQATAGDISRWDSHMAVEASVTADGLKWIDGKNLPIEGRAFDDVEAYYDRLPASVTANVNAGVRSMKSHTAGMQFRFSTDSRRLVFRWTPTESRLAMDHMPATGASGIDVYRFDCEKDRWLYVKTGRIKDAKGGSLTIGWKPGAHCLVNLPLYNGLRKFTLGIETNATVRALPPRKSGVVKPVMFYGGSITQGACASRPGMSYVNIVGRKLDVPVVNLGFSGSGLMELEMSEHVARIDASCYVLDCLGNMNMGRPGEKKGRSVTVNYEPFIRNLRAKRPTVPIVMAEFGDVYCREPTAKNRFIRTLYEKLVKEGWRNLHYLPKDNQFGDDLEGTVEGVHPNDWGMLAKAKAFGKAVAEALEAKPR